MSGVADAVSWRELDLELVDFVPFGVGAVPFGDGQELAQATARIEGGDNGKRVFGDGGRRGVFRTVGRIAQFNTRLSSQ